jgi:2'-5' RNA ligase
MAERERYFIASIPPPPIFEQGVSLKRYFRDVYQSRASLNSPPHVTLHMPFEWPTKSEDVLVDSLAKFLHTQKPVDVHLAGFGCFPPRVIYVNVVASAELSMLQKQTTQFSRQRLNLFNADYRDLPFHPHLTVAFRDLKKSAFEAAWREFKDKAFDGSYSTKQISLLKRIDGFWQPIHDFDLDS